MKKIIMECIVLVITIIICILVIWKLIPHIIPHGSWMNIVDGDSMMPTLKDGQLVFSDKTNEFHRGDIVMIKISDKVDETYSDKVGVVIIKRVIGEPGETIRIDETGVYVNEEKLNEEYLTESARQHTYQKRKYNTIQLGEDEYYVMGDNREVSFDSRAMGAIRKEDIRYKQSTKLTKQFWVKMCLMAATIIGINLLFYFIEKALRKMIIYKYRKV